LLLEGLYAKSNTKYEESTSEGEKREEEVKSEEESNSDENEDSSSSSDRADGVASQGVEQEEMEVEEREVDNVSLRLYDADYYLAFAYFQKAAEAGNAQGQCSLGGMLFVVCLFTRIVCFFLNS
jgi:TPR repeat protein